MSSDEDELFRADTFPYPDSLRKLDLLDVLLHDDGSQQEGDELYVVAQHLGVRVKRRFRERIDPLETMEDEEFKETFGLSKVTVKSILAIFEESLRPRCTQSTAVSAQEKLLTFLHFVRKNASQHELGSQPFVRRNQAEVAKTINTVARIIADKYDYYVTMPSAKEEEEMATKFHAEFGFPQVRGVLKSTRLCIVCPKTLEQPPAAATNGLSAAGKTFISMRAMVLADCDRKIRYFDADYPQGNGTARVYKESEVFQRLHESFSPSDPKFVLADEKFRCSDEVLTPIPEYQIDTVSKQVYNDKLRKCLASGEQAIGVLKGRFRCLLDTIRSDVNNMKMIVYACIVLHNLAMELHEAVDELGIDMNEDQEIGLDFVPGIGEDEDYTVRDRVLDSAFTDVDAN